LPRPAAQPPLAGERPLKRDRRGRRARLRQVPQAAAYKLKPNLVGCGPAALIDGLVRRQRSGRACLLKRAREQEPHRRRAREPAIMGEVVERREIVGGKPRVHDRAPHADSVTRFVVARPGFFANR
jgi:hypothetical protein